MQTRLRIAQTHMTTARRLSHPGRLAADADPLLPHALSGAAPSGRSTSAGLRIPRLPRLIGLAVMLGLVLLLAALTSLSGGSVESARRLLGVPVAGRLLPPPALFHSLDRALWLLDVLTCLTSGLYVYRRDDRLEPALSLLRANSSLAANIFHPAFAATGLREAASMSASAGCDERYRYSHCHLSERMLEAMQWQWAMRRRTAAAEVPMSLDQLESWIADRVAWAEAERAELDAALLPSLDAVRRRDYDRSQWAVAAWFTRYFGAWNQTLAGEEAAPGTSTTESADTDDPSAHAAAVAQNEARDRRIVQLTLDAQAHANRDELPMHSPLTSAARLAARRHSVSVFPDGGDSVLSQLVSLLEREAAKLSDARDPSRAATQVDQSRNPLWEEGADATSSMHCVYQPQASAPRDASISSWNPHCRACMHDPRQPRSFEFGGGSQSSVPSSALIDEAMLHARFSAHLPDGSTRLPRPSLHPRFADTALRAPLPPELLPDSPVDLAHPPVYLSDLMPTWDAVRELQRHRVLFIGDSLAEQQRHTLGCASGRVWPLVLNVALIEPGEHQGRVEWSVTEPFKHALPQYDVLILAVGPHLVRNIRYFSATDLVATRKWIGENARHTLRYLTEHWHGHAFFRPSGVGHPHCASPSAWDRVVHRRPQSAWSYARDADSPFLHWLHDTINEVWMAEMSRMDHPRLHFVHFDALQRPRLDGHVALDSQAPRGERTEDCLHYCLPHPIYAHANAAIAVQLKKIRIKALMHRAMTLSQEEQ